VPAAGCTLKRRERRAPLNRYEASSFPALFRTPVMKTRLALLLCPLCCALAHGGQPFGLVNEWHGPARAIVSVVENKVFFPVGSQILCLEGAR